MKYLKYLKLFEDFEDNLTYECSGSPSPTFSTKADFVSFMSDNDFKHTTLTKKTKMLIVQYKGQGTLKEEKAKKYNIPIYTYKEAKKKIIDYNNEIQKYNL